MGILEKPPVWYLGPSDFVNGTATTEIITMELEAVTVKGKPAMSLNLGLKLPNGTERKVDLYNFGKNYAFLYNTNAEVGDIISWTIDGKEKKILGLKKRVLVPA